jgi:hypothetical protein
MLLGDWETLKQELVGRDTSRIDSRQLGVQPGAPFADDPEPGEEKKFPPLKEVKKKAVQEAEGKLISAVLQETGWKPG